MLKSDYLMQKEGRVTRENGQDLHMLHFNQQIIIFGRDAMSHILIPNILYVAFLLGPCIPHSSLLVFFWFWFIFFHDLGQLWKLEQRKRTRCTRTTSMENNILTFMGNSVPTDTC